MLERWSRIQLARNQRSQSSPLRQNTQPSRHPSRDNRATTEYSVLVRVPADLARSLRLQHHTRQRHHLQGRNNTTAKRPTTNMARQQPLHHQNTLHRKRAIHYLEQHGQNEQPHRPLRSRLGQPRITEQTNPPQEIPRAFLSFILSRPDSQAPRRHGMGWKKELSC